MHGFGSLHLDVITVFLDARLYPDAYLFICTVTDSGSKVKFLLDFAKFMVFILSFLKISVFGVTYEAFLFALKKTLKVIVEDCYKSTPWYMYRETVLYNQTMQIIRNLQL